MAGWIFQEESFSRCMETGDLFLCRRNTKRALHFYFKALSMDADDAEVFFKIAACYYMMDDFRKAEDFILKALKEEPEDGAYHTLYANILLGMNKLKRAEGECKIALEQTPEDAYAYQTYARACFLSHRLDEGCRLLKEALSLDPEDAETYRLLATLHLVKGENNEARKYAKKALSLNPMSGDAYHALGMICLNQEKTEEGLAALREAVRLNPEDKQIREFYQSCAGQLKEFGKAHVLAYLKVGFYAFVIILFHLFLIGLAVNIPVLFPFVMYYFYRVWKTGVDSAPKQEKEKGYMVLREDLESGETYGINVFNGSVSSQNLI